MSSSLFPISVIPHRLKLVLIYYSISTISLFAINHSVLPKSLLAEENFQNWDARNYLLIKDEGYAKKNARFIQRWKAKFRVAFFPLFPMLWRLLDVSAIGMSIINGLFFMGSFLLLAGLLNFHDRAFLLCLSIPNAIFFFLPYTEATFFFTSSLLLIGLKKQNNYLTCIGILLSSLARPAFTVFIPAIILLELFTNKDRRDALIKIAVYLLMFAIAYLIVGLIQFLDTGEWFKFLTAQQHWGARLRMPELPITTFQGGIILLLDGAAFLTGTVSAILLIAIALKKEVNHFSKPVLFSLLYVAGISFAVILFRGGDLFSLNRFVFATPFFFILLHAYLTYPVRFEAIKLFVIPMMLLAFWIPFGAYQSLSSFLPFLYLTGYLAAYVLIKSKLPFVQPIIFSMLLLVNFILQQYFYFRFLSGGWVA